MRDEAPRPPSGHVFRVDRKRGPVWYAKYRLPDGRQVQTKLGPAWSERGRPPATKRTAEAWLRETLDNARRGTLPGMVRSGATFADAAAEWLRHAENERGCKPTTMTDYRSVVTRHLLPAFGEISLEDVTARQIVAWRTNLIARSAKPLSPRTPNKCLAVLHGIFERARRVYGLPVNPAAGVEPLRERYDARSFDFYTPEEVAALVRAATSEQDATIYLTAAFTGLRRGELVALRWRDVDFERQVVRVSASYAKGALTAPKSGRSRAVPMVPDVARALARLGQREHGTGDDDLVFRADGGGFLDASALRRRYVAAQKAAGLRPLRFHDLRHPFGTLGVVGASSIGRAPGVAGPRGHQDDDALYALPGAGRRRRPPRRRLAAGAPGEPTAPRRV